MNSDIVISYVAVGAVGFAFNWLLQRNQASTNQGLTLAGVASDIKTIFRRLDNVEETQDDHAEEQRDLREVVILQGSHIDTLVSALNQAVQRMDVWFGDTSNTHIRVAPSRKTPRSGTSRKRRRRGR